LTWFGKAVFRGVFDVRIGGTMRAKLSGMTAAKQNKFQLAYASAVLAFETAKNGYDAEIDGSGLKARIEAADDDETLAALDLEDAPIFAKWNVSKLGKELDRAEGALLNWSLNLAIEMKPQSRAEIEALRSYLKGKTRHDEKKAEAIRLAMSLPA
jgi:hypothetical protein